MKQLNRMIWMTVATVIAMTAICAGAESYETVDLMIKAAELTDEPVFIDWIQEEIPMQLIAMKNAEGKAYLAFNTCRSCNGSPWAWFEYTGDGGLECQNCGQRIPVSMLQKEETAGCAPIQVPDYTENGDGSITVPKQVLAEAAHLFTNWRKTGE